MDEHLKRQLRELSNTHAAAVQAATASLNTSAVRMALDSYPSLSAMAGMSEQIATLTYHHADALKQVRLTADRMSLGNMAAMIDISKIGRQMQEAMSVHTSAISMAGISIDRDFFDQASSFNGAIEKIKANLTFPVDDWSASSISRAVSDLRATTAAAEAFARIGVNDFADLFANSGIGRYTHVLDTLTSSLKSLRTQEDFEKIARTAFGQTAELVNEEEAAAGGVPEKPKYVLTPMEKFIIIAELIQCLLAMLQVYAALPSSQVTTEPSRTASPPSQQTRPSSPDKARIFVVRGDDVNVRTGPSTKYAAIHRLNTGDIVLKTKQRGAWCQIVQKVGEDAAIRGWIKCRYIRDINLMVGNVAISIFNDYEAS